MGRWFLCSVTGILLILLVPVAPEGALTTIAPVHAQTPDPENVTVPGLDTTLSITVLPDKTYAEVPETGNVRFVLRGEDHRIEGAGIAGGPVYVRCSTEPAVEDSFAWSVTNAGTRQLTSNGDTFEMSFTVANNFRPRPELFLVNVRCVGLGGMGGDLITEFQVGIRVEPYSRMLMRNSGEPPSVGPNEEFGAQFIIDNKGNRPKMFHGEVNAPEGWTVAYPPTVWVPAGESKVVTITGIAPHDKLYYRYDSGLMEVKYWPEGEEGKAQIRSIPATVNGFYLHPALIPFLMLTAAAIVMVAFLVVYARRSVEEQVLGKPIPPWRIPVERQYLERLEKEDPDEYYIVRFHLMVEEHQSALLWYKHFKHTTRKDRKQERIWLKKTDQTKRKTQSLRSRQERLEKRQARRLRVLPARRRRRLAALEKRVLDQAWREQRNLLKEHQKAVKRIAKIHGARSKREKKRVLSEHGKQKKQVEKQNRKRIREGEDPLPLPEEPVIETSVPEFPEIVEVPLVPVGESRLAVKQQRLGASYKRRSAKRSRKAKKRMRRKGAKREKKAAKIKKKIPKPPSTHLYDEDSYVPEDEVVVEDSRSKLQRVLNIPTLEQREVLRSRRMVYRVQIREASGRKDEQQVERLKEKWQEEKHQILQGQKPAAARKKEDRKRRSSKNVEGQEAGISTNEEETRKRGEEASVEGTGGGRFALLRRRPRKKEPSRDEDADPAATQGGKDGPDSPS